MTRQPGGRAGGLRGPRAGPQECGSCAGPVGWQLCGPPSRGAATARHRIFSAPVTQESADWQLGCGSALPTLLLTDHLGPTASRGRGCCPAGRRPPPVFLLTERAGAARARPHWAPPPPPDDSTALTTNTSKVCACLLPGGFLGPCAAPRKRNFCVGC